MCYDVGPVLVWDNQGTVSFFLAVILKAAWAGHIRGLGLPHGPLVGTGVLVHFQKRPTPAGRSPPGHFVDLNNVDLLELKREKDAHDFVRADQIKKTIKKLGYFLPGVCVSLLGGFTGSPLSSSQPLSSELLQARGDHVTLFSFFSLRRALANHVDT